MFVETESIRVEAHHRSIIGLVHDMMYCRKTQVYNMQQVVKLVATSGQISIITFPYASTANYESDPPTRTVSQQARVPRIHGSVLEAVPMR